ncbi:MAG TPA: alkaline phosphatase D family protein [Thermoanaerobaculia bacterium]|nr:alkaline phosphatase D family protein [Thermoanaerobaculia bacterium]
MRARSAARAALVAALLAAATAAHEAPARGPLRSGPLVGATEISASEIWLQSRWPCRAQLRFWPADRPAAARLSEPVSTAPESDHIARFRLSDLEFGTRYEYEVYLDGRRVDRPYPTTFATQPMWRWRTDPPPVRVAVGSCAYINDPSYDRPGKPYGSDYQIFAAILAARPDLMVWLGDNVYYREADWSTEAGMRRRNAHTRELPELQPLWASLPHYAAWDDHDYGPNNSDASFRGGEAALRVFRDYWANPSYGRADLPGAFTRFEWADVEFFLLDGRTYRTLPARGDASPAAMLGPAQLEWLQTALGSSVATFKVVVSPSQALNPMSHADSWTQFPAELEALIDFLRLRRIEGVLFVSGDRHHTELIRRDEPGFYPLYDFTSSSLTAGMGVEEREADNPARVPGTWVNDSHNFGLLEVSGPAKQRRLTLRTLDAGGRERWRHEIAAATLRLPPRPQ